MRPGGCRRTITANSEPPSPGLMAVHGLKPESFLDYVHDIDVSVVSPSPELGRSARRAAGSEIHLHQRLADPMRRMSPVASAFSTGSTKCSISGRQGYVPKPDPKAYALFLEAHRVRRALRCRDVRGHAAQPGSAARARHGHGARAFGILRPPDPAPDQEVGQAPPDHVHHLTEDLRELSHPGSIMCLRTSRTQRSRLEFSHG